MTVTIDEPRPEEDCHRCGKPSDLMVQGKHDVCAYCGNQVYLCRACAREVAAELMAAAQEPTSSVEADFSPKWDVEGNG